MASAETHQADPAPVQGITRGVSPADRGPPITVRSLRGRTRRARLSIWCSSANATSSLGLRSTGLRSPPWAPRYSVSPAAGVAMTNLTPFRRARSRRGAPEAVSRKGYARHHLDFLKVVGQFLEKGGSQAAFRRFRHRYGSGWQSRCCRHRKRPRLADGHRALERSCAGLTV